MHVLMVRLDQLYPDYLITLLSRLSAAINFATQDNKKMKITEVDVLMALRSEGFCEQSEYTVPEFTELARDSAMIRDRLGEECLSVSAVTHEGAFSLPSSRGLFKSDLLKSVSFADFAACFESVAEDLYREIIAGSASWLMGTKENDIHVCLLSTAPQLFNHHLVTKVSDFQGIYDPSQSAPLFSVQTSQSCQSLDYEVLGEAALTHLKTRLPARQKKEHAFYAVFREKGSLLSYLEKYTQYHKEKAPKGFQTIWRNATVHQLLLDRAKMKKDEAAQVDRAERAGQGPNSVAWTAKKATTK